MLGFRFRCYPTEVQAQVLARWMGCQRFIYNAKVREDRYFRTFARKSLALAGQYAPQDQAYSQFVGEDTAWLREVPSQVLRNGATRWKQAYSRFYQKLGGRPTLKKATGRQAVWLTSELFEFIAQTDTATGDVTYRLRLGTKSKPLGELAYVAHRAHTVPASIRVGVEAGRWFVSFSNDTDAPTPTAEETAAWLAGFEEAELLERAVGLDRGVAVPLMASTHTAYDIRAIERERIARKVAAARRWQRKLARRAKGGANRQKAKQRIASLRNYEARVRENFAHQTSHALVADPRHLLFVFEALNVQRMTKRAKARQDPVTGKWLRNGARAKSGLNKAILRSAWGKIKQYMAYKALAAGKLSIEVPAHYTSQECARCGHTHPDNRPTQAEFICQACGYRANADANAAEIIRRRGVTRMLSGEPLFKPRKKIMAMRKKQLGAECSEVTSVEMQISQVSRKRPPARIEEAENSARELRNPTLQPVPG